MSNRERPGDRGRRRATEQRIRLGADFRRNRVGAGLSLRAVGAATRLHHVSVWRFERGLPTKLRLEDIGAIAAVVGLDLAIRAYPDGDAIRDASHARLLDRFRHQLHPSLRWHTEVPLPGRRDLRAWDAVTGREEWRVGVEAETVIADTQAVDRKVALKARDGVVDHVILLVADTRRNRRALAAAGSAFAGLPLRTRDLLAALRSGDNPVGAGS